MLDSTGGDGGVREGSESSVLLFTFYTVYCIYILPLYTVYIYFYEKTRWVPNFYNEFITIYMYFCIPEAFMAASYLSFLLQIYLFSPLII